MIAMVYDVGEWDTHPGYTKIKSIEKALETLGG